VTPSGTNDLAHDRISLGPSSASARLVVAAAAIGAGALALLISWSVLELVPHVGVSYLFQGRILAAGALYLPPPPLPVLFGQEDILLTDSRWCSIYPPGWPLLLALGWLGHAPWLLSPLLLALAVLGIARAGRALYDPTTGALAALALAASPVALLMAGDATAHVPALCATVWCLAELALGVGADDPATQRRHLLIAGFCGGFGILIRPVTTLALLAPWGSWGAWTLVRGRRTRALGWAAAGLIPCLLALALYNWRVFGSPLATGYAAYDPHNFASAAAMTEPVGIALGRNLPWYLKHLNRSLWGFPWGDLVWLAPALFSRGRRGRDVLLVASAASLVIVQSFYIYGDIVYSGPRLAFESLGPFCLLAARSVRACSALLRAALARVAPHGTLWRRRGVGLAVAGAAAALLVYFPLGRRLPAQMVHHAQWYFAQSAAPLAAARRAGVGPEPLVFVAGTPFCYTSFFLSNSLHPALGGAVFVRDVPPLRAAAMRVFRRSEVWLARVVVAIDPRHRDQAAPLEISWRRLR
jgi:hypothetical protein